MLFPESGDSGVPALGFEGTVASRRQVGKAVTAVVMRLELPVYETEDEVGWFVYVVRLKGFGQVARDEVFESLRFEGIACSNYFSPIHLQPYFEQLGYRERDFPISEKIALSTMALPFYNKLQTAQICRVSDALKQALSRLSRSVRPSAGRS